MSIGRPSARAGWRARLAAERLSHAHLDRGLVQSDRFDLAAGRRDTASLRAQPARAKAPARASAAARGTMSSTSPPKRAISLTRLELT